MSLSPQPDAPRPSLAPVIAGVVLVAAAMLAPLGNLTWTLDDAWISFRVARSFLTTGHLTFDPAFPPVEGMTNLLWCLLSACWIKLFPSLDPIEVARLLGGVLHLAGVAIAALLAARHAPLRPRLAAAAAGLTLGLSGSGAYHALSGLETPLFVFLFLAALERLSATLAGSPRAAWSTGVLLGLLAMTRPEGVLLGGIVCATTLLLPAWRPRLIAIAAPFTLLVGGMELFRLATYGALVPNTFHAKPPNPLGGLEYLRGFLLYGVGVIGPLAALPSLRRDPLARLIAALSLVMLLGTVWSGGDWMPGFRRFAITSAGLSVLVGMGLGVVSRLQPFAFAAAAILLGHGLAYANEKDRNDYPHWLWAEVGALASRTPQVKQVALSDIGRFGWAFPGSVMDLGGLTDAHIARQKGLHGFKAWDDAYFRERNPDLILMISSTHPSTGDVQMQSPEGPAFYSIVEKGGWRLRAILDLHAPPPLAGGHLEERHVVFPVEQYMLVFARDGLELPAEWGPAPDFDWVERVKAFKAARKAEAKSP